ncbi:MAG TPA: hydroxyacid dehydrogenase [Thermoflexales bacterium]|mgnify:FL=1|nr:hydroxyacid dehydrogenase [Thermoflexales bacterium]
MQRYVWFEWKPDPDLAALIDGTALALGPAAATPDDPLSALGLAHGAIATALPYNAALMDRGPNLLVISRTGIGVDTVDIPEATRRGIAVCNTPDGPTISTAEQTLALMLGIAKRLRRIDNDFRRNAVPRDYYRTHNGLELHDTTLGLVGIGRIGGRVAGYARALGMRVLAYDPFSTDEAAARLGVTRVGALDELLSRSDVVSLHLPLTAETRKMMNAERFAQMKPGAIFINAARGGLVDEAALLAALESGRLSGAGLDVTDPEPPRMDNPLLHRDDVIITPHIASATSVGKRRIQSKAISQVVDVLNGRRPEHLVNPEVWPAVAARYAALFGQVPS